MATSERCTVTGICINTIPITKRIVQYTPHKTIQDVTHDTYDLCDMVIPCTYLSVYSNRHVCVVCNIIRYNVRRSYHAITVPTCTML